LLAGTDKPAIKAMIKWHGVLPLAEIADNLFTVIVFKAVQKFRKSSDSFFVSSSSIFILIFRFFPDFCLQLREFDRQVFNFYYSVNAPPEQVGAIFFV